MEVSFHSYFGKSLYFNILVMFLYSGSNQKNNQISQINLKFCNIIIIVYLFCISLSSLLIFSISTSVQRMSQYPLMTVMTLAYKPYSFCRRPSSFFILIRPGYSVTERPNSCSPTEQIPYLLYNSSNCACNPVEVKLIFFHFVRNMTNNLEI